MQLLDSTVYRELLLVPPDTTVPKKRMTLKRLRKAQRLREEVSSGQESRSIERVWAPIRYVMTPYPNPFVPHANISSHTFSY